MERQELGVEDMAEDEEFTVNCLGEDTAVTLEEIRQAMTEDAKKRYMSQGTKMSDYTRVFKELSHMDGVLLRGTQLVIPPSCRSG